MFQTDAHTIASIIQHPTNNTMEKTKGKLSHIFK